MTNYVETDCTIPRCEGCDQPLDRMSIALGYTVCMDCTRARQRAVLSRKCVCGSKRRPTEVKHMASRTWISCYRCLGQIKQLS